MAHYLAWLRAVVILCQIGGGIFMLSRRVGEMHKILMLPDLASDGGGVSYERPLEDPTGSR